MSGRPSAVRLNGAGLSSFGSCGGPNCAVAQGAIEHRPTPKHNTCAIVNVLNATSMPARSERSRERESVPIAPAFPAFDVPTTAADEVYHPNVLRLRRE